MEQTISATIHQKVTSIQRLLNMKFTEFKLKHLEGKFIEKTTFPSRL